MSGNFPFINFKPDKRYEKAIRDMLKRIYMTLDFLRFKARIFLLVDLQTLLL